MSLPDTYTLKPGSIPDYFDAIRNAQPPERFSQKFLEGLGFKSTNDRLIIGLLKDLGFLDSDGKPLERYFQYLDKSISERILAEAIRDAFSDLFAVRTNAQEFSQDEVKDKLRTLYAGKKSDQLISRIAATFNALCEVADFTTPMPDPKTDKEEEIKNDEIASKTEAVSPQKTTGSQHPASTEKSIAIQGLQYHINIILPESRDQAIYDAIFKSLRSHLG